MDIATNTAPQITVAPGVDLDLVELKEACAILGGKAAPLHFTTFYKGIKAGKYPAPIKMGPGTSRWLRRELLAVVAARLAERDAGRAA